MVTCKGNSFVGRVAASLLNAIGLPELVADTLDDYEALALSLARNPQLLQSLRQRIEQNRLTRPLFDTKRYTRNIEAAYLQMWDIARRGEAPYGFGVEAAV
jgi:protein O-GlcNAc transferase